MPEFKDYYQRRLYAQNLILSLIRQHKKAEKVFLISQVMLTTGLGARFCREFLKNMVDSDQISQDGDIYYWVSLEGD